MKRKKIVIFTISPGGVTQHISLTVSLINKEKFEIIGIFPENAINKRWHSSKKSEYREIFEKNKLKYYIVETPRNISIKEDFKALLKIVKILKAEKPDILHCHSSMAGFIGRVAGKISFVPAIIYTPHTVYYAWLTGLKKYFYFFIEKFLTFFTNYIIAVSPSEENFLKKTLSNKKVIKINNGINISVIKNFKTNVNLRKNLKINENMQLILSITRLSPPKDTETLLKAIKIVSEKEKNFILLIAGDGEQREQLQSFLFEEKIDRFVKFLGWVDNIYDYISISDIAVLSSFREGLPYAIIEPSAFGKPVIGTNTEGIKDCIIHNRTGFLFEKRDYNQLSNYIIELLNDRKKSVQFGMNGKIFIENNFNAESMSKQLEDLYAKC